METRLVYFSVGGYLFPTYMTSFYLNLHDVILSWLKSLNNTNPNDLNLTIILSALKALKNDKKLNKNLRFYPISTILGKKVNIVGHYQ